MDQNEIGDEQMHLHMANTTRQYDSTREWLDRITKIRTGLQPWTDPKQKSKMKHQYAECTICFESEFKTIRFDCSHAYCIECIPKWIQSALQDHSKFPLKCAECSELVDTSRADFQEILTVHDLLERFRKFETSANLDHPVYCPDKRCLAFFEGPEFLSLDIDQRPDNWNFATCPDCHGNLCMACNVAYHVGMTCAQFQSLPIEDRCREDIDLYEIAHKQNWRRCPQCSAFVEKKDGCNHIRCRCDADFCYTCGKKYRNRNAIGGNVHGEPDCNCQLFDVPGEAAVQVQHVAPAPQPVPAYVYVGRGGAAIGIEERSQQNRRNLPFWLLDSWDKIECHYCGQGFGSLGALDMHLTNTRRHQVWACCGRTFRSEHAMEQHRNSRFDHY